MAEGNAQRIIDWLLAGAQAAEASEDLTRLLCEKLTDHGIPLWRVGIFIRTLHPDVMGRAFIWRPGAAVVVGAANHSIVQTDAYLTSPLAVMFSTSKVVRRRIADGDGVAASPFLQELQAEGATDYIAIPLIFTDGSVHAASWSTKEPGGFTEEHLALLHALTGPLSRVCEIRALRRTAINLLDTYVGNRAGSRILAGQIRRGHTDTLDAVIWLSDMRGFTSLSDKLPPEAVVDLLNSYFDCQVPAILEHGGEVLKFMGDGLLAIFPVDRAANDAAQVCERALAAARQARASIAKLNDERPDDRDRQLRFGLALHIGEVLYGNIGGGNRLDFTCIGPAINLAARIEKLAGQLGRTIVASAEFSRHQRAEWENVGEFSVAGFAARQTLLGLRDETDASSAKIA